MSIRPLAAGFLASLAFGLGGCDALCERGMGGDSCPPCRATSVPAAWSDSELQVLVPGEDAVVCSAMAEPAKLDYWVPAKVHPTNVAVVGAAQEAGWARVEDNWTDSDEPRNAPKTSTLRKETGERLSIDVRTEGKGARVHIEFKGPPKPPQLSGDVTVFGYRGATFALFDGHIVSVPDVTSGVAVAQPDGFFYRHASDQFGRYQGDGTATLYPPFPSDGDGGFLASHGAGPNGFPWVSFNPADKRKPLLLGELIDGNWDVEMVPDLVPPLPYGTVDLGSSTDGKVWLLVENVLYVRVDKTWNAARLPGRVGSIRPFATEADSVLVSNERAVLRARFNGKRIETTPVAKLDFHAELFDAGDLGVVARTKDAVVVISGEEVHNLELPGEAAAPELATNKQGVIAVATRDPATIVVRASDGTVHRYPQQGALQSPVFSMSIDPRGRVWTLLDEGDPVVADADRLIPLEGLIGKDFRPSNIAFLGDGAPPLVLPAEG